jgi:hypothetical protein
MVCTCAATSGSAATLYGAIILVSISSAYPAIPSRNNRSAVALRADLPSAVSARGKVSASTRHFNGGRIEFTNLALRVVE